MKELVAIIRNWLAWRAADQRDVAQSAERLKRLAFTGALSSQRRRPIEGKKPWR